MARLHDVNGVTRVTLGSSEKSAADSATPPTGSTATTAGPLCGIGSRPDFSIVIHFERSQAAAGVSAARRPAGRRRSDRGDADPADPDRDGSAVRWHAGVDGRHLRDRRNRDDPGRRQMSRTTRILLIGALVAGAAAAYWYLALAPKRAEVAALDTKIATTQATVQQAEATAANYEASRVAYRQNYATVVRLGKAVPADDDVRSLVVQIDTSAKRSKIDFNKISLDERRRATTAPARRQTSFATVPFSFSFQGSFFRLSDFFSPPRQLRPAEGQRRRGEGTSAAHRPVLAHPGRRWITPAHRPDRRHLVPAAHVRGAHRRRHGAGSGHGHDASRRR